MKEDNNKISLCDKIFLDALASLAFKLSLNDRYFFRFSVLSVQSVQSVQSDISQCKGVRYFVQFA